MLNKKTIFCKTSRMKYVNKRGFIGPIGDDMPSLVPIVVALLLFFTIFTMTLTSYNNKNAYLRKQTDMTSIARELKGDTLILGVAQFDKRCNNLRLKKIPYNFVSAIYPTNIDINVVESDFASVFGIAQDPRIAANNVNSFLKDTTPGSDGAFFCSYQKIGGTNFSVNKKNYVIRFYPVAVQYPVEIIDNGKSVPQYLIVPAVMAMLFWE